MSDFTPIKVNPNVGDSTSLAEFQATDSIGIVNGGTGATTEVGAKTNLSLDKVDNTADVNKPISTAVSTALAYFDAGNITDAVV
jgi:hypothetical protein